MSDLEIVKALECCVSKGYPQGCDDCPYRGLDCNERLDADALDLINRQNAKIDTLQKQVRVIGRQVEKAKIEAYKLFAERLKETFPKDDFLRSTKRVAEDIDNLLKEVVGE